jgi:FdhD protein
MTPFDEAVLPAGVRVAPVSAWRDGRVSQHPDWLAQEVPVALVFNGISHAVMLASPHDLADFALGFGLTEGLLENASDLYGCEEVVTPQGIELHLEVAAACEWRLKERRRNLAGRTGCGLCGTESLTQVQRSLPTAPEVHLTPEVLGHALRDLRQWQAVQQLTGASHAAAWCTLQGHIALVREDIGRHNALDKLVGAMVKVRIDPTQGWLLVTSRASFEMVQKAAMVGAGLLAAVSAPTALAVEVAQQCGLALAGFVRGADFVAYTHPERFGLPAHVNQPLAPKNQAFLPPYS